MNELDYKPLGDVIQIIALFHIPQCHLFFCADGQVAPVARVESNPYRYNMRQLVWNKLLALRVFPVNSSSHCY